MKSKRRPGRVAILLVSIALTAAVMLGCRAPAATLELTSYKDPYFPEHYQVMLADCAYRVDAGADYHIVGRALRESDDPQIGTIEQAIYLHLFWKPAPGKTFDNASSINAIVRYMVRTRRGCATYGGTAYVYVKNRRGNKLHVKVERAHLRLQAKSGDAPDLIGNTRLTGEFVAIEDGTLTLEVLHAVQRRDLPEGLAVAED